MHISIILLIASLAFSAQASLKGDNDSSITTFDSSLAHSPTEINDSTKPTKVHRYSLHHNELISSIWPILDIRASYPLLISLEIGLMLNLTSSEETDLYDPINGPAVFTELSFPGLIAGFGANFGKISGIRLTFIRPEICYSRIWTNRFSLINRSQYLGTGITGSFYLAKVCFRIFRQIRVYNSKGYLLYFGLGFGI